MCGIVAALAAGNIVPIQFKGINKLKYCRYALAPLSLLNPVLTRLRSIGRVADAAPMMVSRLESEGFIR